ncbi:MAG: primosomal protein N' [Pseudomonadota bacterium]
MTSTDLLADADPNIVPLSVHPVLLPIPTEQAYSYSAPADWNLQPGDIVRVPLGPRKVAGVVWHEGSDKPVDPAKLREIEHKFPCPPVGLDMLDFVAWVANYTLASPGMVMQMVLRVPAAFDPEPPMPAIIYNGGEPDRLTAARSKVLELARETFDASSGNNQPLAWTRPGLAKAAGVSTSVVDGLIKQNLFDAVSIEPRPVVAKPDAGFRPTELSQAQAIAADELASRIGRGFSVTLIDGVTGSGKTEVYFEAVAAALEAGRQVLILIPEISLTTSFLERFEKRFGAPPAPWHSDLTPKKRERIWRQVASGEVRVVAGARSALFLPFKEPGLIIVDEEHDLAYKQDERVAYNARDMAVVRARIGGFPAMLASATPSIESHVNADAGRYHRVVLPTRHSGAVLPDLGVVDMRGLKLPANQFLSPKLKGAITETIERGEQSLLFLNRRGYAPLTLCRACGHRFECSQCTAWLVEHRFRGTLECHHCGHHEPKPQSCPNCGALDYLVPCGPGVERLAEEVEDAFPDARTIILSSDLMGGTSRLRLELDAVEKGEADIVIGTQLVAKGHNFPLMTLVGVVDADLGLAGGDPRAAERTFQMLSQVTGRAGRFGRQSQGLLQTYQPDHPVMQAIVAGDRDVFYEREIEMRRRGHLPPFGRLAAIIISANSKPEAEGHARQLARAGRPVAEASEGITVLGPAEAPMAMVRGRHRQRLLVHATRQANIQKFLRAFLAAGPKTRGSVRVNTDVDPQSFV